MHQTILELESQGRQPGVHSRNAGSDFADKTALGGNTGRLSVVVQSAPMGKKELKKLSWTTRTRKGTTGFGKNTIKNSTFRNVVQPTAGERRNRTLRSISLAKSRERK